VLGLAVLGTVAMYAPRLRPERFLRGPTVNIDAPYWESTRDGQEFGYYERAYDPVGVTERAPQGLDRWTIVGGRGDVNTRVDADDEIALDTSAESEMQLRINSHAFPNWGVRIDGVAAAFRITPSLGFMEVTAPAGAHRVDAHFDNTAVRRAANVITLLSFLLGAALCVPERRTGHRR
jgi:hypothetical protein